jgi:hypothetical protein
VGRRHVGIRENGTVPEAGYFHLQISSISEKSGFFLLLPEGVVRIDNCGKRTREHRDQDEPDGKIRDQRPGTAHDTGNPE